MSAVAANAGVGGRQLVTRHLGRRVRPCLEALLAGTTDACLLVSFDGVELMDASFADEVFAVLAANRARRIVAPSCLVLRDLSVNSHDNLALSMISRPVREAGLRNCVLPVLGEESRLELVGKYEDHVGETFGYLQQMGQVTARDLAEHGGLEIAAASTRLKVTFDLGLAHRREARDNSGRLYVYASIL